MAAPGVQSGLDGTVLRMRKLNGKVVCNGIVAKDLIAQNWTFMFR